MAARYPDEEQIQGRLLEWIDQGKLNSEVDDSEGKNGSNRPRWSGSDF